MIPIERYLEKQLKGLKVVASKRKPGALAMQCEYRGKKFAVGFKSPTGAPQMIAEIRRHM